MMILLIGASGYVGRGYVRLLAKRGIDSIALRRDQVDGTRKEAVAEALRAYRPQFVINAAGFVGHPNVDASEDQKLRCLQANTVLPATLAEVCADFQIVLGHVSTGCIYQGSRPDGAPFTEEDPPNLTFREADCSFYSGTKAMAETLVAEYSRTYQWRLRFPFEHRAHPRNYLAKVMRYERLLNVRNSISHLDEFCHATVESLLRGVPFGIYNLTNPGSISTQEIVEMILRSGIVSKKFEFFADEMEFRRQVKVRRAACLLDSSKLLATGIPLSDVREAIDRCLQNWQSRGAD
jgi:dTDP-4-dehydrorhamnose reductase